MTVSQWEIPEDDPLKMIRDLTPEAALKPDSGWIAPGPGEWTPTLQRFALAMCRVPFPVETVGLLPKAYNKNDQDKFNCEVCGGFHAAGIHLDYIGHATVTDRLLTIDPWWGWEPFALDEYGLPLLDSTGSMWIRLTIADVTRIGYGDGPDAKQRIGDAIRNAGMRFGIATYLWTKDELESLVGSPKTQRKAPPKGSRATSSGRTKVTAQDPATAGKTQMSVDDRNKISKALNALEVRGPNIPKKLAALLGLPEGETRSLSKLTAEDGPVLFAALNIPLPKPDDKAEEKTDDGG